MKTFNNLNVGAKIIGTLAIILGLTLLIAGLGLYFLNGMNGRLNNIVDVTAEEIKLAAAINRGLVEVGRAEKNMLLADTQEDMDVYATPIALLNDNLTNDLTRLQALTDAEGAARLEQFQAAYDEYLGINNQVRSLTRQNSARRAFLLAFGQGRDLFDRLEAELDELVQKLEADMNSAEGSEDIQIYRDAAEKTILVARLKQNLLTISRAEKNLILAKTAQNQEAAAASLDREQAQMQQRRAQLRDRLTARNRPCWIRSQPPITNGFKFTTRSASWPWPTAIRRPSPSLKAMGGRSLTRPQTTSRPLWSKMMRIWLQTRN